MLKCFPLFVDISASKVLVVGGGNIALRRVKTLLKFDFSTIDVVSKNFLPAFYDIADSRLSLNTLELKTADDIALYLKKNPLFVFACTNNLELNTSIVHLAQSIGIKANSCTGKDICDFYFPAIEECDGVTIGCCGDGVNHKKVKDVRVKITEFLKDEL